MKKINKSVVVVDFLEFFFVAKNLAKQFDKVYYCSQGWASGFPQPSAKGLGTGFKNVEHIDDIQDYEDEIDYFIFPDIYFAPTANRLKRQGKKVWGSGDMEFVERDRILFYDLLKEAKLPVPETKSIVGVDKLAKYLDGEGECWIKISELRGLAETWKYIDKRFNELRITKIKNDLGCMKDEMEFLVQKPIPTLLEYGCDTYMVNSKFPDTTYFGFEQKGESYFTKFEEMKNLPEECRAIHDKFSKVVEDYDYTGFWSDEVRVTDKKEHMFIDPAVRCGFPSSPTYTYLTENWGEIIDNALSKGITTPIRSRYKYGAEVIIRTSVADHTCPVYYDQKYEDNIMPTTCAMRDGILYRVQSNQLYCDSMKVCSAVAGGDTLEEAIDKVTEVADSIKSEGLEYNNSMKLSYKGITDKLKEETGYEF